MARGTQHYIMRQPRNAWNGRASPPLTLLQADRNVIILLLRFRACIEAKNSMGETPLYAAVTSRNISVVALDCLATRPEHGAG